LEKTVCELFAGVGGFHLGLEKADRDFNIIWANQWEPGKKFQYAFDCYKMHFGSNTDCINKDIAEVKYDIPRHTLLVGGFPCQDYSVAATGAKGIHGKKGVLWWEIRDILQEKNPPFVLLENVDRLIKSPSKQRGKDFGIMLSCFENLGYNVEWRVINAADYGFAQRRRRIFIFAYRNDTNYTKGLIGSSLIDIIQNKGLFAESFPIESVEDSLFSTSDYGFFGFATKDYNFSDTLQVSDEFAYEFKNSGVMYNGRVLSIHTIPVYETPQTLQEIVKPIEGMKYYLGDNLSDWVYMKGAKKLQRKSKTGYEYTFSEGAIPFPDPLDKPARTMLTSEASKNRSTHVIIDPGKNQYRLLTPEECEELNGFDVGWTGNDIMPHSFRYFCMGNALVVGLIEKIGIILSKIIEKE
jgi:DNA-methyltransferase (dcm)